MPTSDATEPFVDGSLQLQAADIVEPLARRNPTADPKIIEEAGRVVALVSRVMLSDTAATRRFRDINDDDIFNVLHEMKASIDRLLPAQGPVEEARGSGLGEIIGLEAGLARLAAYSEGTPLDEWAGPVVSVSALRTQVGISSSNLKTWRRKRAVIELRDARQRSVFPTSQFVEACPVPHLAELQTIIGDPRTSWLWLIEPSSDQGPSWLDRLKKGEDVAVLDAAREDFA